ncbi:MAG: F0F1 ATP synthase subunit epsilon, partial [Candidatus Electrothrix sp. EH2]|nr:F0F1 ATP synthase subunit epsilon [Candidatus Electrothrix sp. EH2]
EAKERAEKRLARDIAHADDLDRIRAEAALQRAVARLAAAQRTKL